MAIFLHSLGLAFAHVVLSAAKGGFFRMAAEGSKHRGKRARLIKEANYGRRREKRSKTGKETD